MTTRPRSHNIRRQRGAALLEALIAFLVLGLGTVAGVRLQSGLRFDADMARDRALAIRLGEAELEAARSYSALTADSGRASYAAIVDAAMQADPSREAFGAAAATSYRIERHVVQSDYAGGKQLMIDVAWIDRRGGERRVGVGGFIAAADPAWSGALALGTGAIPSVVRGYRGRHPAVALDARDLGDGRSAWTVDGSTYLVDNRSGDIVARCSGSAIGEASSAVTSNRDECVLDRRLLLSGTIRFAGAAASIAAARGMTGPVEMRLSQTDRAVAGEPVCQAEAMNSVGSIVAGSVRFDSVAATAAAPAGADGWAETGDRYVSWRCLVAPSADAGWSGRLELRVGGRSLDAASGLHVCRLDPRGDSATNGANIEAMRYRRVTTASLDENFLIVADGAACPTTLEPGTGGR